MENSVGPIENRPLNENRWNYTRINRAFPDYFQSLGLGFYEYFLLSEDLGAEPLPVLNCGLSCQYESNEVIPLAKIDPYVQDALDLIEFAMVAWILSGVNCVQRWDIPLLLI